MEFVGTKRKLSTISLVYCALFTALIAIGAFIKVMLPLGMFSVTFSLQFLFVLMAGLILGPRQGLLSIGLYLFIGLMGIPIFAHGGGPGYLARPTFGFLMGFAVAAFVTGLLVSRLRTVTLPRLILAGLMGELAYYACGLIYYFIMFNYVIAGGKQIGVAELLSVWFLSTVLPDFGLVVVASIAAKRIRPLTKHIRG